MARHEVEREDLIAEATALTQRAELTVPGEADLVIAGVRGDGRLSVYFGSDPVYQFTTDGGLRRAFVEGVLYRSQGATLARLVRSRSVDKVELERHDLSPGELAAFLETMAQRLAGFQHQLQAGQVTIVRQVPAAGDFLPTLLESLPRCLERRLSSRLTKR
jgi:hypothetical protein